MIGEMRRILGRNLRSCMSISGYSSRSLAEDLQWASGVEISDEAIRHYTKGDRPMETAMMVLLAKVLNVSEQTLIEGMADCRQPKPQPMRRLSQRDHAILSRLATSWRGDIHALIVAMGVYAALPEKYAAAAIMSLMEQVSLALAAGDLSPEDLPEGIADLEDAIGELIENGKT